MRILPDGIVDGREEGNNKKEAGYCSSKKEHSCQHQNTAGDRCRHFVDCEENRSANKRYYARYSPFDAIFYSINFFKLKKIKRAHVHMHTIM